MSRRKRLLHHLVNRDSGQLIRIDDSPTGSYSPSGPDLTIKALFPELMGV